MPPTGLEANNIYRKEEHRVASSRQPLASSMDPCKGKGCIAQQSSELNLKQLDLDLLFMKLTSFQINKYSNLKKKWHATVYVRTNTETD
jgi:hypothetical protein